jgi:hypothetical protein
VERRSRSSPFRFVGQGNGDDGQLSFPYELGVRVDQRAAVWLSFGRTDDDVAFPDRTDARQTGQAGGRIEGY